MSASGRCSSICSTPSCMRASTRSAIDPEGQLDRPAEAPVGALAAVPDRLLVGRRRLALAGNCDDVLLDGDVDVGRVDARQLCGQRRAVGPLPYVDGRKAAGGAGRRCEGAVDLVLEAPHDGEGVSLEAEERRKWHGSSLIGRFRAGQPPHGGATGARAARGGRCVIGDADSSPAHGGAGGTTGGDPRSAANRPRPASLSRINDLGNPPRAFQHTERKARHRIQGVVPAASRKAHVTGARPALRPISPTSQAPKCLRDARAPRPRARRAAHRARPVWSFMVLPALRAPWLRVLG